MGRKRTQFFDSAIKNEWSYRYYKNKLFEIGMSMFKWENLPETIDSIYLERSLFFKGAVIFFFDEDIGYLALRGALGGPMNVYNVPQSRQPIAPGYHGPKRDGSNSVIIYNNMLRNPTAPDCEMFAYKLYNVDRTIDTNINAQKTPVVIVCEESERLSMLNLMKDYDGNVPFIFGSKSLDLSNIKVLNTEAPFIAGELSEIKANIWNEALTHLGVPNVSIQKRERLNRDEVNRNMGGTIASRFCRLEPRQFACEQINKMFGLNISVDYRDNFTMDGGEYFNE